MINLAKMEREGMHESIRSGCFTRKKTSLFMFVSCLFIILISLQAYGNEDAAHKRQIFFHEISKIAGESRELNEIKLRASSDDGQLNGILAQNVEVFIRYFGGVIDGVQRDEATENSVHRGVEQYLIRSDYIHDQNLSSIVFLVTLKSKIFSNIYSVNRYTYTGDSEGRWQLSEFNKKSRVNTYIELKNFKENNDGTHTDYYLKCDSIYLVGESYDGVSHDSQLFLIDIEYVSESDLDVISERVFVCLMSHFSERKDDRIDFVDEHNHYLINYYEY